MNATRTLALVPDARARAGGRQTSARATSGPTPSAARRAREREETRERIIDVAREMLAADRYEAVTMRRLADRVEYTPPVIYRFFADKAALMREICVRDYGAIAQNLRGVVPGVNAVERLRRLGQGYVEFALTHPHHYRLMFMTPKPHAVTLALQHALTDEVGGRVPEFDSYGLLRAAVDDAVRAGDVAPAFPDPELIAHVLWQSLHGIIALHLTARDNTWVEYRAPRETAHLAIDVLIRGLTGDHPQTPAHATDR